MRVSWMTGHRLTHFHSLLCHPLTIISVIDKVNNGQNGQWKRYQGKYDPVRSGSDELLAYTRLDQAVRLHHLHMTTLQEYLRSYEIGHLEGIMHI